MKKIATYIITIFVIFILFFAAGYFTATKTIKPETVEITKEIEVVKEVDRIVYRDVEKLTFVECKEYLNLYDTEPMVIDYEINKLNKKYTDVNVNWKLYERSGNENIKVPVYQSGNFKFYAGIGAGVVGTAGLTYLIYSVVR